MEKYDIIILAGQSNAEGTGYGPVEKEYVPNENVLTLDAEKIVEVAPEGMRVTYLDKPLVIKTAEESISADGQTVGCFALRFATRYVEAGLLEEGRKLLIVRAAIGGTGFQKGNWGLTAPLYLKLLEMTDYALSLNPENKVVAFLWHQGEHDAFEGNLPENYKKQLFEMFTDARARYGNMPVITADFANEWKTLNIEICAPIIEVIKEVSRDLGNAAFVETADLLSNNQTLQNGDTIHFSKQSLYILGGRYFNAFQQLKKD